MKKFQRMCFSHNLILTSVVLSLDVLIEWPYGIYMFSCNCLFSLQQVEVRGQCKVLVLVYQSLGMIFGDLSLSPLYVYGSTFSRRLRHYQTEDAVFGAFAVIFWTLTLISMFKYVLILLSADDNGEGKI